MAESAFRFWIEFLKPHGAWKVGHRTATHEEAAEYLCGIGKAKRSCDPRQDARTPFPVRTELAVNEPGLDSQGSNEPITESDSQEIKEKQSGQSQ